MENAHQPVVGTIEGVHYCRTEQVVKVDMGDLVCVCVCVWHVEMICATNNVYFLLCFIYTFHHFLNKMLIRSHFPNNFLCSFL